MQGISAATRGKRRLPTGDAQPSLAPNLGIPNPDDSQAVIAFLDKVLETPGEFRRLTSEDAKERVAAAYAAFLRHPLVVAEWRKELVALNEDIQAQFTERKREAEEYHQECDGMGVGGTSAWLAFKRDYDAWQRSTVRFKGVLDARLRESKRLLHHVLRSPDRVRDFREKHAAAIDDNFVAEDAKEGQLRVALALQTANNNQLRRDMSALQDALTMDFPFSAQGFSYRDELVARIERSMYPDGRKNSEPPPAVARALANVDSKS